MKGLKITSALLSAVMCVSMVMAPVAVIADETEAPSETETTETQAPETTPSETESSKKEDKQPAPEEKEEQQPEQAQEPEQEQKEEPAEEEKQESEPEEGQLPEEEAQRDAEEAVKLIASGQCGKKLKWTLDINGTFKVTGKGSMYGYTKDNRPPWNGYLDNIKKVEVSKGVTTIGAYAFKDCHILASVSLPKGLKIIGDRAFCGCYKLTNISLPKSVRRIDQYAFCDSGLKSIVIPKGVTEIKEATFAASAISSITIPNTVKTIGECAFDDSYGLKSITIPSSVKTIGNAAFRDIPTLTTVNLPVSGLTSIGTSAFSGCSSLSEFRVPLTVTSIGDYAFANCSVLCQIWLSDTQKNNLPSNVTSGSPYSYYFEHSYCIIGEQFNEGNLSYIVTNPSVGGTSGTVAVYALGAADEKIVVPNTVTHSKDKGYTNVTYKVTKITASVSQYNDTLALKNLVIGSNVSVIADGAFANCQNLVSVTGGAGLKAIGSNAFANCPKLKVFTINSKVLYRIGASAFYADKALVTLNLKKTTKLTKSGVKNSLKGSSVKTVKVKKSKLKKYKKIFKKKNSGRGVKVKK